MADVDPFADPTTEIDGDPFAQPAGGGGNFPSVDNDLVGELVLLYPSDVEMVPDKFSDEPKTKPRLTATTVVLTGELAGQEFDDMWWSQSGVVKSGQAALKKGQKMILGRIRRVPTKDDVNSKKFEAGDYEAIEKALSNPKLARNTRYATIMAQYDEADAAIAREYLASK